MRLWTLFTAFPAIFVLLFTACSDKDKNAGGTSEAENSIAISDKTVAGVTQKGPFTKGSTVTLYELNFGTLAQTGKSFFGKISDSTGSFSINKIELASQYALLQAEGYYLNEITGKVSASQIALNAISDLSERDNVNINLLTHLEYERAVWLANENETTIKNAKAEADREIFSAFGMEYNGDQFEDLDIFGNGDADAALLAISIIMHAGRTEGEFSLALANMAMDLEKDGKWDDAKAIAEAADNSFEADTAQIRMNMEAWNIAESIPDFAPIVEYFWNDAFGLGRCTEKREGEIKPDSNSHSRYFEKDFICVKSHWYLFNQETHFYANQIIYEKCGGKAYDPSTQKCFRATVEGICGKGSYDLKSETCVEGVVKRICGSKTFDTGTQFCVADVIYDKCNGEIYDPSTQKCVGNVLMGICGNKTYDLENQVCDPGDVVNWICGGAYFTPEIGGTWTCINGELVFMCGEVAYNPKTDYCTEEGTLLPKCGETGYNPKTQYCNSADEVVELSDCGTNKYNPETQYCSSGNIVLELEYCAGEQFNPKTHYCRDGVLYKKSVLCGGSEYDPETQYCSNNIIRDMYSCGESLYNPEEAFCYDGSTIYDLCSGNSYNPDVYTCVDGFPIEDGSEYDALNNTLTDLRDGQVYKTTVIAPEGTDYSEVWMAENLNLVTENSWCVGGSGTTEGDCSVYGRLYTWAAAVAKSEEKCGIGKNCNLRTGNIRGICPKGWHLPNQSEWDEISTAMGGPNVAVKVIKSETGWKGENTDAFGFSALPAGYYRSGEGYEEYYSDEGFGAYFWSSTEYGSSHASSMNINNSVYLFNNTKSLGLSVRCLKD